MNEPGCGYFKDNPAAVRGELPLSSVNYSHCGYNCLPLIKAAKHLTAKPYKIISENVIKSFQMFSSTQKTKLKHVCSRKCVCVCVRCAHLTHKGHENGIAFSPFSETFAITVSA